jgi:hypothetical protein
MRNPNCENVGTLKAKMCDFSDATQKEGKHLNDGISLRDARYRAI